MKIYVIAGISGIAAIMLLMVMLGSWYTVDQGERAIVLRAGAVKSVSDPGLHWKAPMLDEAVHMSVQTQKETYSMESYSRDQQPADLSVSVNYRINPADVGKVYENYGSLEGMMLRLITPRVQQESKVVFGRFNAVTAIQDRGRLNIEIMDAIAGSIAREDGRVIIESVQVEGVTFSAAYEDSIEQRMLAEVEVQRIQQNLEREKVQAEIVETQAAAEANATRLRGQAEADAIAARGQALNDNPNLVELVQAERWNGVLPTTMVPSGALPVIGMK